MLIHKFIHEEDIAQIARDLISAIGYCHEQGICHRNIKPENIMLDLTPGLHRHQDHTVMKKEGEHLQRFQVKLTDFYQSSDISDKMSDEADIEYTAPEVLLGDPY